MQEARQRAEYTFKHNHLRGRHGWLRLTPAYSVKVVDEILDQCGKTGAKILDPFAGTTTTALCAAARGYDTTTLELNKFLVWFGRAKVAKYSDEALSQTAELCKEIVYLIETGREIAPPAPPIHNINRWWNASEVALLRQTKYALERMLPDFSQQKDLLLVAFCRTLIEVSNAAFNHQSMSFKNQTKQLTLPVASDHAKHFKKIYQRNVDFILHTARENPLAYCEILEGDARTVGDISGKTFDLVITSPPYVNRMSYIRELRPYMYWLGFLNDAREAGELDWKAIGGTWGIATSRLSEWKQQESLDLDYLDGALNQIGHVSNKNGPLLRNYVAKYFEDIWMHMRSLTKSLADGAQVHYIVGNSTFYNVVVPAERIYADMLRVLGFCDVNVQVLRKRNSKKALFEFDVSATWVKRIETSSAFGCRRRGV